MTHLHFLVNLLEISWTNMNNYSNANYRERWAIDKMQNMQGMIGSKMLVWLADW